MNEQEINSKNPKNNLLKTYNNFMNIVNESFELNKEENNDININIKQTKRTK